MNNDQTPGLRRRSPDYAQQYSQSWLSTAPSDSGFDSDYAFSLCDSASTQVAETGLPLWRLFGDMQGPDLDPSIQSSGVHAGLAHVYNQPSYGIAPIDHVFQTDATSIEDGQHWYSQNLIPDHGGPLQQGTFFSSNVQEADAVHANNPAPFGQSGLVHDDQAILGIDTPAPVPAVACPDATLQMYPPLGAVVLQMSDGLYFCSQLGCDAIYSRIGDCRRHLKKHNGPFFYCEQRGCGMKFYRHDKLRAHMQQGHGVAIPPPGNRRRQRRSAIGQ
ncbi:hypothetical protein N0V86_006438 [Didymella sp. IMI 355093]|nr:hypothetical protein N0V86_006438 [Didymella sp. IMI 355093]